MKFRSSWIFFVVLGLVLVLGKTNVFAQATKVSDFNGLKEAVAQGGEIQVTREITVTDSLKIQNNVTISGSKLILGDGFTSDQMFEVGKDVSLTLKDITLDGNQKGRLIYSNGGIISLTNGEIQNGFPGDQAKENPGGGIFLRGGSLTATDTNFTGNTPGTNQTLGKGEGDLNGGSIYSGSTKADITITGGSFENNKVEAYGHGAAIYQENGSLTVNGTSFKNNKGHVEGGNAGTQGACIHTRDKVTATISDVNAEIAKGFNTGGFLRSWKSDVTVTDSKFTIKDLGDGYGYSGGALCFEGGTSKVKGSTFTCNESKLIHAGGFIDIVGTGTHVIDGNKMTGAGMDEHKFKAIASFGGAISVEEGANATVTITNNTITDTSASDTGGAIAIGTHKGKSTPSTVTMSGNTITNPGTYYYGGQYGGGVFVAPDATVTMSKDTIKNAKSSYGGGVYNEGKLTITGGSSLTGGVGSKLGGEIYNNGDLTVDNATVAGDFVGPANWDKTPSHEKKYEHGGTNIYAEKDVTITPKANITTGKDVRVLDGQSKILLTGPLTKEIDVSVSEIAGGNETQNRKVGYVVAAGKDGYTATKSDANFLHYIGKTNTEDKSHYTNQPRADFEDDKSTGKWDFVLDQDNGTVVLGQRVKLIYHGNLGKIGSKDSEEELVDIYKTPEFWDGKDQLKEFKAAKPTRDQYSFMGWYYWKDGENAGTTNNDKSIQDLKNPKNVTNELFDFSKVIFQNNVKDTDKIITPNVINTYAGWSKNIDLEIAKEWKKADGKEELDDKDKKNISVTLYDGEAIKETKSFDSAANYGGKFENLQVFTKSYEGEEKNMNLSFSPKEYKVVETEIPGFSTSYNPEKIVANSDQEKKITITNTKTQEFGVSYEFVSGTKGKDLPDTIKGKEPKDDNRYKTGAEVEAQAIDNKIYTDAAKKTVQDSDGVWTFEGWKPEKQSIKNSDIKFIGTWTFIEDKSSFEITKTVDKKEYKKDDTLNYTVTVKNTGNSKIENLSVSDPLATKVKWKLDQDQNFVENQSLTGTAFTLNVGESLTIQYEYKVTQEDVNKEIIENTAKATLGEDSKEAKTKSILKKNPEDPKPPVQESTTNYLDQNGNKISPSDKGTQKPKDIPGYEFIKTEKPSDKVTNHIYKKIVKDGPPRITFWAYPTEPEPVSDKGLLNKEDHKAYMFGYDDGNFGPEDNMTREEVTAMFARLLKDYPRDRRSYQIPYSDVSKKNWSYEAIGFMTEKGMVKGYQDGSFRPKAPVTRAEFAAMASRFDRLMGGQDRGFKDVKSSHWAFEAINSAAAKGWVKGYPDGTFKPDQKITRSEVVSITNIMLDRYADKDFVRKNIQDMIYFKDLTEANWAYFPIMEATHGHDYTRKALQEENWIRLNGEEFRFPLLYRK